MKEKINEKLNEAFNKYADVDCPMWCEIATNGVAYLTWHTYQDSGITPDLFKSVALVVLVEFKSINDVQCPWWHMTRKMLMKSISDAKAKYDDEKKAGV